MRVSTQTLESNVISRSYFAFFVVAGLVMVLLPVDVEVNAAQTSPPAEEFESTLQSSALSAGANSTASLDDPSDPPPRVELEEGLDSEPLPNPPAAPQSILMPQTPTAETFTETNSDGGIGSDTVPLAGDGSQAIGTFAKQDPFVSKQGQTTLLPSVPAMNSEIPPISHNGLRGASPIVTNPITSPNPVTQPSAPSSTGSFETPPQTTFEDQTRRPFGNRIPEQSFGKPTQPTFEDQPRRSADNFSRSSGQESNLSKQNAPQQLGGGSPRTSPPVGFNALPIDRSSTPIDNQVKPTGFNQLSNRPSNPNDLARQLLSRYEVDKTPSPLPGRPTSLLEMLRQPIPVNRRRTMVNQYWETYYDWATFLSRAEHLSWLNSIASPSSPSDQALLRAAKSAAGNHVLAAEIQLGKSQSRLTDFLPSNQTDLLPLPSDKPLVQKYKTNYELYRQHGMMPVRLRGIDGMLPKMLRLIQNRADTVQLAQTAADNAKNGLTSRQSSLPSVLAAARIWRAAEQDLVASVTSYNKAIADYSLTIASSSQTPEQIVGMLIAKPKTKTSSKTYPRTAQQPRSTSSQYSQPSFQNQPGSRSAAGQQQNGNFGPAARSLGQPISRPASNQGFGSGGPVSHSTNNQAVAPATASSSSFNGSPTGQSFGGAQQSSPARAANSQFNQFRR